MLKDFAVDCKQAALQTEWSLTTIAVCVVSGVRYGSGETFQTASKDIADYMVAQGLAVTKVAEEQVTPAVAQIGNRIVRKAGKAKS